MFSELLSHLKQKITLLKFNLTFNKCYLSFVWLHLGYHHTCAVEYANNLIFQMLSSTFCAPLEARNPGLLTGTLHKHSQNQVPVLSSKLDTLN